MKEQRKLAAIMFTDIVGYTALMSKDEQNALLILQKSRDLLKTFIKQFNGEWLQAIGDGTLSSFASVVDAVNCALEVQRSLKGDPELSLRIGIHIGDVVLGEGEIYGDGVNVASRLEALAEPGGICISGKVYSEIRNKPDIEAVFLGEKTLKNVDLPLKVYALTIEGLPAALAESKPSERPSAAKPQPSIVVLPFINMSPDPEQEYFSDGLTEEIITDLSQVHKLLVISRSSAMTFKGTKKKIREIAGEVNVQYVLEGSVRKAGNNLRIVAQLIDAINDAHLWAEKYSGTLDDVFDIQEKVSRSIVNALKLKLSPEEKKKIAERPIENVQAYECYLRARHEYWRWTEEAAKRALQYLQEGLKIVGDNVFIYAGMAEAYFVLSHTAGKEMSAHLNKVEECAKKIFELKPESSYGYCLLGLIRWKEPKPQESVKLLKRAFDINPNDTETLFWLSFCAAEVGKPSIAEPCFRKLMEIDPLSPMSHFSLGWFHLMSGRLELALKAFCKTHQMAPESPIFGFKYARALALNQQLKEAYSIIDLIIKNKQEEIFTWISPFYKLALQGNKIKALKAVTADLKTAARTDETVSWYMAEGYALIDEKDEALDWLEHAVWRGVINYPLLSEYDPFLENIRGEKRFKKLMERVKYEWEHFEV